METPSPLLLLASLLLLLVFFIETKRRRHRRRPAACSANYAPLKSFPIVGNFPHLLRNFPRILQWSTELLLNGSTVTVAPIVFTSDPANIQHILRDAFDNYPRGSDAVDVFRDFLGDGIFNTNGELWRLQRKIASHEFNTKSIRSFVMENLRRGCFGSLIGVLKKKAAAGEIVDFQETLDRFAFDNVCSVVFGHYPRCLDGDPAGLEFLRAFDELGRLSAGRFMIDMNIFWRLKKVLRIGTERRLAAALRLVRGVADEYVKKLRRKGEGSGDDLISRFAAAGDGSVSDELLRDVLMCFVLAGRDTTPAALTWFFWVVATRPEIVEKVRGEVEKVRRRSGSSKGGAFTLEELREMQYLHAALSESMRLYPPVPLLSRNAAGDDELPDGTAVRKGWMIMYNSYAMGRMGSIWGEDCEEFLPERWMDEEGVFRPASPFKYPVFHGGPRVCLGKEMAYMQMKAVAASVLEELDVELAGEAAAGEIQLIITMRMKGGLPVRFRRRSDERDGQ